MSAFKVPTAAHARIKSGILLFCAVVSLVGAARNYIAVREVSEKATLVNLEATLPPDVTPARVAWYVLMIADARAQLWAKIRLNLFFAALFVVAIVVDRRRTRELQVRSHSTAE
jgi:hypothetical protein